MWLDSGINFGRDVFAVVYALPTVVVAAADDIHYVRM
jgi:hypothetical protein